MHPSRFLEDAPHSEHIDWVGAGLDFLDGDFGYRALIRDNPDALYIIDREGRFVAVNKACAHISGRSTDELIGNHFDELLAPSGRQAVHESFAACLQGEVRHFNVHLIKKDGSDIYVAVSLSPFKRDGTILGVVGISRDVTARVTAERALVASEQRYRGLFQHSLNGIVLFDASERVVDANPAACRMIGCDQQQLIGRARWNLLRMAPPCWPQVDGARAEGLLLCQDGTSRWVEVSEFAAPEAGAQQHTCVSLRDLTQHRQAQQALTESRENLRRLSASLQTALEDERRKLARELHDDLGQRLTSLRFDISWLQSRSALQGDDETARKLATMDASLQETMESVRRISRNLRPLLLDELGLVAACEWLTDEFSQRTGMACEFAASKEDIPLPADVATAAFRIVQEALTNVSKHSAATRVTVGLRQHGEMLQLNIVDDGTGIKAAKKSRGLGLLGMQERVYALSGSITLDSGMEGGLRIRVQLPIAGAVEQPAPPAREGDG